MPNPDTFEEEADWVRKQAEEALTAIAELHQQATATILLSPGARVDEAGPPSAETGLDPD